MYKNIRPYKAFVILKRESMQINYPRIWYGKFPHLVLAGSKSVFGVCLIHVKTLTSLTINLWAGTRPDGHPIKSWSNRNELASWRIHTSLFFLLSKKTLEMFSFSIKPLDSTQNSMASVALTCVVCMSWTRIWYWDLHFFEGPLKAEWDLAGLSWRFFQASWASH